MVNEGKGFIKKKSGLERGWSLTTEVFLHGTTHCKTTASAKQQLCGVSCYWSEFRKREREKERESSQACKKKPHQKTPTSRKWHTTHISCSGGLSSTTGLAGAPSGAPYCGCSPLPHALLHLLLQLLQLGLENLHAVVPSARPLSACWSATCRAGLQEGGEGLVNVMNTRQHIGQVFWLLFLHMLLEPVLGLLKESEVIHCESNWVTAVRLLKSSEMVHGEWDWMTAVRLLKDGAMLYDDSKWQLWGCWKTAQCSMMTVNDSCEVVERRHNALWRQ